MFNTEAITKMMALADKVPQFIERFEALEKRVNELSATTAPATPATPAPVAPVV